MLALFMGSMGAGALLAGRLSRTRIDARHGYATIEAALGFCALIFHPLFVAVTALRSQRLVPHQEAWYGCAVAPPGVSL